MMEEKCPKCGSTNFAGTGTQNGYVITCAECDTVIVDTVNEEDVEVNEAELMELLDIEEGTDFETFECEDCKL